MTRFEDLPENQRALLLARLNLEMAAAKVPNIQHLARTLRGDLTGVWRNICRKAGQPVCSIPEKVMKPSSSL